MDDEKQIKIQVDLLKVYEYINSDIFQEHLFSTTDISIGTFIIEVLNKTIKYMMEDISNG